MKINTLYNDKRTYAPNRKISFIVIHYTAETISKTGTARNTASYFKTSNAVKIQPLIVDGEERSVEAININGSNFVPIRGLAAATGKFDVEYENGEVIANTR